MSDEYGAARASRRYYEGRVRWYDAANRVSALLRGTHWMTERRKAVNRLDLRDGSRVLEVCVGTGTNIPLMREFASAGAVVGLDISRAMLRRCAAKMQAAGAEAWLVEGEAAHLPFRHGAFDALLNHGGLAEFGDRASAIGEMARVTRPGGRIVICDVGVPADGRLSLRNRWLLSLQPEYRKPPPVDLLPADARDVRLSWIGGGGWYLLEFANGTRE